MVAFLFRGNENLIMIKKLLCTLERKLIVHFRLKEKWIVGDRNLISRNVYINMNNLEWMKSIVKQGKENCTSFKIMCTIIKLKIELNLLKFKLKEDKFLKVQFFNFLSIFNLLKWIVEYLRANLRINHGWKYSIW